MIRQAVRVVAAGIAVSVVCLLAGFVWFALAAQRTHTPPPHADGIVALTGGPDRVEAALHLLADGHAEWLLVSGVGPTASLAELARRAELEPAGLAGRTTLGRAATTTVGNADEAAEWVRTHDLRSLIVVTAGYHMQRALLELGRTLPQTVLFPYPVQPAPMTTRATARLLVSEYLKLLGAVAGISLAMPFHARGTAA